MTSISPSAVLGRVTKWPPAYFVFVALLIALWATRPQLMNINIMGTFIRQVAPLGIVVLGQLLVMNARSIDLSAGGVILVVNYILSSGSLGDAGIPTMVAAALATGIAVGLFNGLMIGKRRLSAVVVTLAVNVALMGIVEYLANGKPPGNVPDVIRELYETRPVGIPAPILFWAALAVLMSAVLSRLVFGRWIASIGENPTAAHYSGVPVQRSVVMAHVIAGILASVAGLVQTASIAVGSIRFGPELVMNSIAATILGGVIFGKGTGGVLGPFVGVLCFSLLFVLMTVLGVREDGKLVAQGLIIMLAAIVYGIRTSKS
ncbi:monosaccharide ABC transporter membrane protein, CUT2 family [Variovorax sp. YR750]|uniref:ABC transporter permease n=1 Tax=Variovorax sp. YR750 TaxID=1884384 RepID=UPI0008C01D00|nr:ABC transporter permease [Variovorax sp. YR750]SEM05023.1 monosaccharide ABC transporter membrane protein, CUT2 family [Variovorax sp. YR750]